MSRYTIGGGVLAGILALLLVIFFVIDIPSDSTEVVVHDSLNDVTPTPITLVPRTIQFADGTEAMFEISEGMNIAIAAEGIGKARFMAMSSDNRLFVPDLVNYLLSPNGSITILENFNEDTKHFETKHTYLSNLQGVNDIEFYTDENGNEWLYVATTAQLTRYPYQAGDIEPSGAGEVVATFPARQAPGETSVVWHITRTIEVHDDRFYISVGSGCNSCEDPLNLMRGMIVSMDPDGSDVRVYADGLRNAVGLEWALGSLYATENGVDHLGVDSPDERLYKIEAGAHYAWPYCYEKNGEVFPDNSQEWETPISCEEAPRSVATFPPRSAPLGLTYFEKAHPLLQNSFLVSLHGSFNVDVGRGYELVRALPNGETETFMRGFLNEAGERVARPVDVLQHDENSFFLTDDHGGRVFYLFADE